MASTCRGCGAEIVWVHTTNGRRMPLDAKRTTIAVALNDHRVPTAGDTVRVLTGLVPHHITCPEADTFRKGGG